MSKKTLSILMFSLVFISMLSPLTSQVKAVTTLNITVFDESGFPPASIHGANRLADIPIAIYALDGTLVVSGASDSSGMFSFNLAEGRYKIVYGPKVYWGPISGGGYGIASKIVDVSGSSMNIDLYCFSVHFHSYEAGSPNQLDYFDLDTDSEGYQYEVTVQPGQQVNAEFSFWELETFNYPVWFISAYGSWNPTSALKNLATGSASPTSHQQYIIQFSFSAPDTPGDYEVRLKDVLDYDWPNSFYTQLHYQPSLGRDMSSSILSKGIDALYGIGKIIVRELVSTVYVDPAETIVDQPNEPFNVTIKVTNAPEMSQYILNFTWDPSVIELETGTEADIVKGTFLGGELFLVGTLAPGRIEEVTEGKLSGYASGSGTLFTIKFRSKAIGTTQILIDYAVFLKDLDIADIPTRENGTVFVGDFVPPEIESIEHIAFGLYPSIPSTTTWSDKPILVIANITEPAYASGVAKVFFSYRANGGDWWNTTMRYNATMGLWSVLMPGQLKDTFVEFFITAYDNAGNVAVSSINSFTVETLKLGDLGGPVDDVPTFFIYDGNVDGYDLALWIACYKGLGP